MNTNGRIRSLGVLAMLFVIAIIASSSTPIGDNPWMAPKSADQLKNPFKGNIEATKEGKKLYLRYCKVCHGSTGKGDGPAGLALKPRPSDHTSDRIQNQSDGAIFWKITQGRTPMASYRKVLTEEQRWKMVNYIRELAK